MASTISASTSPSASVSASLRDLFDRSSASSTSAAPASDARNADRKVLRIQPVDTVRLSDAVQARILKRQGETVPQIAGTLGIPEETVSSYVEDTVTMLPSDSEKLIHLLRSRRKMLDL